MSSESLTSFPTLKRGLLWLERCGVDSPRKYLLAGLGIIVTLIVAGVCIILAARGQALRQERGRADQRLSLARLVEKTVTGMVTAQQGFLLSRQSGELAEFERLRTDSRRLFLKLVAITHDDRAARRAVRDVNVRLESWLNENAMPELAAIQQGRTSAVREHHLSAVDGLEAGLSGLVEDRSATCRQLHEKRAFERWVLVGSVALFGALLLGLVAFFGLGAWRTFSKELQLAEGTLAQTYAILAATQDGVVVVDDQALIRSINPAAEAMFAHKASAIVGKNISLLIPQRLFFHDMASMGRGSIMVMGQRGGYYPFPIEISLSAITVQGRRQFCALIRDVTDRTRGEETLKHIGLGVSAATGEEFVRSLLKQLSKALDYERAFLVELTGPIGTPTALLTIAERGELRPTVSLDMANSACSSVITKGFRAYTENARAMFPEDSLLGDGEAESFVGMPLMDHQGAPIGVMGVLDRRPMRDTAITESTLQIFAARAAAEIERKRYEGALAAEKERLAVTLGSIADGCISLSNDGRVLMLNPVAEHLTGWTQKEASGQDLGEILRLLDERTRKPCQHALSRIVATGKAEGLGTLAILVHRDGTERLVESNSSPIRDQSERKIGVVIILRDVTERQRLEEERQKAEKLESLGVVAGGIAHDFNNLFTAILGNISLALGDSPGEVVSDRLRIAKTAMQRAQELAGQLLTFAKGGAPVKRTTSLAQLLPHTIACVVTGPRVVCENRIAEDLRAVEADPSQLAQVISTIATNAEQAMTTGGRLEAVAGNLELATDSPNLGLSAGRWVYFSIRDEGVGIPEQYLKKIFDPYFTTKAKSAGLGLATAYSIVKNHGGTIQVESTPGSGSTFTIYLPASENQLLSAQPDLPVPFGKGRVLVLDDEEVICMLVTCALEPLGYEVTETQDPLTAIEKYEESMRSGRRYDLVISDLTMPGTMGGQEAIKRLRAIDPDVRAIVSSGYASDPVMSRFEEFGFSGMIAKPYEIDALGRKVAEVLTQAPRPRVIYHSFDGRASA